MGSGASREGFDLFNKHCFRGIKREFFNGNIFNFKHYFWTDTFSRFWRPFCKHENAKLFEQDGKADRYCFKCNSWLKEIK